LYFSLFSTVSFSPNFFALFSNLIKILFPDVICVFKIFPGFSLKV
jgi:hypothetical protein